MITIHTRQLQQYTEDNYNTHKTTNNNIHKTTTIHTRQLTTIHTRQLQQYTQLTTIKTRQLTTIHTRTTIHSQAYCITPNNCSVGYITCSVHST